MVAGFRGWHPVRVSASQDLLIIKVVLPWGSSLKDRSDAFLEAPWRAVASQGKQEEHAPPAFLM